ncbi:MAG: hypothetical protein JSU87_02320 [Gemmatimonadota bacterium]|nr:MAG: hypothetical protein JSU87_02320 [Gemmatimonadota bacterium]
MAQGKRGLLSAPALLLGAFLAVGCSTEPIPRDYRWVYGTWDWVKAVGEPNFEMTPQSEGFELKYVISRGGLFEIYRSGFLEVNTSFTFSWDTVSSPGDTLGVLEFADSTAYTGRRQLLRRVGADTLVLFSPFIDAPHVYFVRSSR